MEAIDFGAVPPAGVEEGEVWRDTEAQRSYVRHDGAWVEVPAGEQLGSQRAERQREQRRQREQEVADLERSQTLNGYDRNVLRQWVAGELGRKRPVLSFEMQAQWQAERDAAQLAEEREEAVWLARVQARERAAREAREREERWRREHPLKAEAEAALRAARSRQWAQRDRERRERQAAEAEQEWQARLAELEEAERRQRLRLKGRDKEALLAMGEMEFLEWCEAAEADEVEAFVEQLRLDGERAREPQWWRQLKDAAQLFNL
jgi:hypothetical protein